MLTREEARGIYVLVPTPIDSEGRFDELTFRENIQKLCKSGVHGIATTGTVGEFHTISWEDHKRLIDTLVDETSKCEHRVVTIVGCSGLNIREVIEKTKYAEERGVDAVMNVVPFYTKLLEWEVIQFWSDLAKACPNIGIFIYNNPVNTKFLHTAEIYKRLSKYQNIIGSKEIVTDFTHWLSLHDTGLLHMHIDVLFVPTMMWGGKGCFSGGACIRPDLLLKTYEFCLQGEWEKAKRLQFLINELMACHDRHNYPVVPGGSPSVYKAFVEAGGFLRCGDPVKPHLPVDEETKKQIRRELKKVLRKIDETLSQLGQ